MTNLHQAIKKDNEIKQKSKMTKITSNDEFVADEKYYNNENEEGAIRDVRKYLSKKGYNKKVINKTIFNNYR